MKRSSLTLYYDEACPSCTRWGKWLKHIGRDAIQLLPLRSEGLAHKSIDPQRALRAMPALDAQGRVRYGFEAFMAVLSRVWWLWWLWPLGICLRWTGLGARGYAYFATRRQVIGCGEKPCAR